MPCQPAANPPKRRGSTGPSVIAAVCVASMAALAPIAAKAGPQRVVSLNLCADQLALMLLPRDRIVGLTHLANDPGLSALWDRTGDIPLLKGLAEEVLPLNPDLVLAGAFTTRPTIAILRARGIPVLEIGLVNDFDGIRDQIRTVAAALDATARGEELVTEMDDKLAAARVDSTAEGRPRVLSLAPGGFTSGSGTLNDAVMQAAGLTNYAAQKGMQGYGYLSVETVAADPPDLLIVNTDEKGHPSMNGQMLSHPALARAVPPERRPQVLGRLWTCGGPFTADAVTQLAAARDRLPHKDH